MTSSFEKGPTVPRLLDTNAVRERTGLSRTTLWRLERRGEFPRRRSLSIGRVGWLESDVNKWVETRVQVAGAGDE